VVLEPAPESTTLKLVPYSNHALVCAPPVSLNVAFSVALEQLATVAVCADTRPAPAKSAEIVIAVTPNNLIFVFMIVNKVKNNLLFKTMNLFVHNFKKYRRRKK